MRVLVVGTNGMLGTDVVAAFQSRRHETVGLDLPEFDITDPMAAARIPSGDFGTLDWVVNCAAYTAVDRAETEKDLAFQVNALGASYLAQACQMAKVRFIHIGTDFVFDGEKSVPYVESDTPRPLGVYAESKFEGERAALGQGAVVFRTAWLYGPHGPSFPRTMIRVWREGKPLRVVADQIGSPTYTGELSRVIVEASELAIEPGLYHAAGPDAMSWHELAVQTLSAYAEEHGSDSPAIEVEAIRTVDWPTPARRPKYSVLDSSKLAIAGISPMGSTVDSLRQFVRTLDSVDSTF